ncbi:hypothetical protein BC827DRAFT_725792 [Russula dissimulans]|nr:hypothetical protein BC827DRAFT_725792 [Russula dissimulans]
MVMANHNGRATSSIPSWLRPINRKSSPSHHSPARIAGSTRGSTPLTNLNPTQPQHRPSAPQRNSEPPPTTHRVMSTSSSAPASFQPHTSTVKGKATAGTLGDEGQQDLPHAVANLQCGGGAGECGEGFRWISEMEGAKIREEAETALKKNLARRVTPSESTRNGVIQSKRARTAAACDDDTEFGLSWRRKTRSVRPPVMHPGAALARDVTAPPKDCSTTPGLTNEVPGPPRNPSSSNVNHPINSVTRAGDVIAPSKEYGITPRVTNEIPLLGKPGPPSLLDEENMPSSEIPQPALGWVPEQSSNGTISKERRCPLPRECRAEDVCMLHISPPMPQPELPPDRVGVFPVLDCPHASDSMDHTLDDDTPLAQLVLQPRPRGTRQRPLSSEGPQRGEEMNNARANESKSRDVDPSPGKEDTSLGWSYSRMRDPSPSVASRPVSAEASHNQSHHTSGRNVKAKATKPDSDARGHPMTPKTSPRKKRPRAKCSEDEASGDDLESTDPPRSIVHPAKCSPSSGLRPRVWAGGKEELFAALPALEKNHGGVACEGLCPTLIFSEESEPGLGRWEDDAWEGRRITFSIVREVDIVLHPPARPPVLSANDSPLDAERMVVDTPSLAETSSRPPSQKSAYNGGSPAAPRSGPCNYQATDSLFGSPGAGPSRVTLETLMSAPSLPIGAMEITKGEMNHSSSFDELDLLFDFKGDSGAADGPMSSLSRDVHHHERIAGSPLTNANHDGRPDRCSPTVELVVEPICVGDTASFEGQSSLVNIHGAQSAQGPTLSPESGGANHRLSCSAPSPNQKPSKSHTPLADPNQCVTISDRPDLEIAPSCSPLLSRASDSTSHMPFPQPPPEVTALLMTHSSGDVVPAVFARNSPLVPWELPSEIGYFWLGLFKISEVKVTYSCHCKATDLTSLWIYLFAR